LSSQFGVLALFAAFFAVFQLVSTYQDRAEREL
jgi:hypothetical protein